MILMETMPNKKHTHMIGLSPLRHIVGYYATSALGTHALRALSLRALKVSSLAAAVMIGLSACVTSAPVHTPRLSPGVLAEQAREAEQAAKAQSGEPVDAEKKRDLVVEANPDQLALISDAELAKDPSLPTTGLDSSTLEQLLLMSFASFEGCLLYTSPSPRD